MTPPSDGSLFPMSDSVVGEGMYTPGGYSLQASYLLDERFDDLKVPTLRVHVFSQSHWKSDGFLSVPGPETDPEVLRKRYLRSIKDSVDAAIDVLDRAAPEVTADQLRRLYTLITPLARKMLDGWAEPQGSYRHPYRARKDIFGAEVASVTQEPHGSGYLVRIHGKLHERWMEAKVTTMEEVLQQVDDLLQQEGFRFCAKEE